MSTHKGLDKQIMTYLYNGTLLSKKKKLLISAKTLMDDFKNNTDLKKEVYAVYYSIYIKLKKSQSNLKQ